ARLQLSHSSKNLELFFTNAERFPTVPANTSALTTECGLMGRFGPAAAGTGGDFKRDTQAGRGTHLVADQLGQRVELTRRRLEDQLVVHLKQHPRLQARRLQ